MINEPTIEIFQETYTQTEKRTAWSIISASTISDYCRTREESVTVKEIYTIEFHCWKKKQRTDLRVVACRNFRNGRRELRTRTCVCARVRERKNRNATAIALDYRRRINFLEGLSGFSRWWNSYLTNMLSNYWLFLSLIN